MPPRAPQQPLCRRRVGDLHVGAGQLGGAGEGRKGRVAVGEAADVGHEARRGRARAEVRGARACSISASQSGGGLDAGLREAGIAGGARGVHRPSLANRLLTAPRLGWPQQPASVRLVEADAEPGGHLVHQARAARRPAAGRSRRRRAASRRRLATAGLAPRAAALLARRRAAAAGRSSCRPRRRRRRSLGTWPWAAIVTPNCMLSMRGLPAQPLRGDVGRRAFGAAEASPYSRSSWRRRCSDRGDVDLHAADVGTRAALGAAPEVVALQHRLDLAGQDEAHDASRAAVQVATARAADVHVPHW